MVLLLDTNDRWVNFDRAAFRALVLHGDGTPFRLCESVCQNVD